jgi:hypothetical protein
MRIHLKARAQRGLVAQRLERRALLRAVEPRTLRGRTRGVGMTGHACP